MIKSERKSIFLDEKLQKEFELRGYVCLNILSEEEIQKLKDVYEVSGIETPDGFYSTSFNTNEELKQSLENAIQETIEKKTPEIFHSYQSLGACYLSKAPGLKGLMPFHQDWTVVDEDHFDSITIWVPLVDVDSKNGALQVIPGSHRFSNIIRSPFLHNPLSEIEAELAQDAIEVPLKAGQAIIFSQALMHASPPNLSAENRLAITYGLIHKEAQLLFYYKNELNLIEKYEVPIHFFREYNTQIGQKPTIGTCVKQFATKLERLSPEMYKKAKLQFQIKQNKAHRMKAIFKSSEHQDFFEKEGYLLLPLLNAEEIKDLHEFYTTLQVEDNNRFGFHVSMDGLSKEQNLKVREKIWSVILPKLDLYLENYKPFVASFVIKESNPKGVVPAHQDWSFVDKEEEGYCSITCWTALVDTFLDNGCMGVIKGSHKLMNNHRPSPSPQTPVPLSEHMFSIFPYLTTLEMKAGEVLLFDNRTFHASPPNTTEGIRLAAGVGVTQKDAQLVHFHLKPDGKKNTLQKYEVDEDFFINYNNALLAKMYDEGKSIQDYKLIEELPYTFEQFSSEELVQLIKESGNDFNIPMCEKLSVLFGYDMSGKKEEKQAEVIESEETTVEEKLPFYKVYTPLNIIRELKLRISGK